MASATSASSGAVTTSSTTETAMSISRFDSSFQGVVGTVEKLRRGIPSNSSI